MLFLLAPGSAGIIGDEPCTVVDWQGFVHYAKHLTGEATVATNDAS